PEPTAARRLQQPSASLSPPSRPTTPSPPSAPATTTHGARRGAAALCVRFPASFLLPTKSLILTPCLCYWFALQRSLAHAWFAHACFAHVWFAHVWFAHVLYALFDRFIKRTPHGLTVTGAHGVL